MKTFVRLGAAALVAAALLLAAATGPFRRPAGPGPDGSAIAAAASGSGLLGPAGASRSLEASITEMQDRLRTVPGDWRGFATLGLAYVAQAGFTADPGWYPRAEAALHESLRLHDEDNVEGRLGLGALALARHDFEAALAFGRRARVIDPHSADALGVTGDALIELGRYDEAFEAIQAMVDVRPDLASYARVAYARELLGDLSGATSAMERAFESAGTPEDAAWAAHRLGELDWAGGDVGGAETWYRRGLDLAPTFVPNAAGLAKVSWARGDTGDAIERYREVVLRYPAVEQVAALGDLYASVGEDELAAAQYAVVEATRSLAEAAGVNVDLEVALFDADHGDPASALAAARAEWGRRRSVHVADALAWALHANGRDDAASRIAERALALGTRDATLLFHAGMIEHALGRDAAARRLLREALDLNPFFSILHAATAARTLGALEAGR